MRSVSRCSATTLLACAAGAVACLAPAALAQSTLRFNEVMVNVPGNDNGFEYFEVRGEPGASLAGVWIVTIDGDNNTTGTSVATGKVDFAYDLSAFSLGSNGLLLLRDSATVLQPAPAPETTVIAGPDFQGCGSTNTLPAVNIDIENGTASYLLVRGFTGAICDDLDTDNNGTLDTTPWTQVLDAVGFANAEDFRNPELAGLIHVYATQLGGLNITDTDPNSPAGGFTPDYFARVCNYTVASDALGTNPGPYGVDIGEVLYFPAGSTPLLPDPYLLSPGGLNDCSGPITPACGSIDFNGDGLFPDDSDLIEFLSVLAGGSCSTNTCGSIDFNADGLFPDDNDLIDFLTVLAGGTPSSCTP
jgi:hypothetical protein